MPLTDICFWCRRVIVDGAKEAGASEGKIAWMDDGDYGCNEHPISGEEGVGPHETASEVAEIIKAHHLRPRFPDRLSHEFRLEKSTFYARIVSEITLPNGSRHETAAIAIPMIRDDPRAAEAANLLEQYYLGNLSWDSYVTKIQNLHG